MKKLIALALSTAIVALPTAANAQWHHDRDGDHHFRHDRDFRFRSFGFPRVRTVVSVGVPFGYYGAYGYPYGYGYAPYAYGYPAYAYGYGYPAYAYGYAPYGYGYPGYGYRGYGCNPGAGVVAGGLAGAVIGSAVSDRDRIHRTRFGYRYRRGDGAAGAIIGGVLGAAVGGAVASNNCY
jgi:hypothetical protein